MKHNIEKTHPLHHYHRNRPNFAGRTDDQIYSQWGKIEILEGVPDQGFIAGSYETIKLKFTCGSMGLDESGGICFYFRNICDIGKLQWSNPEAEGYVTATTDGEAKIVLLNKGGAIRPFLRGLWINVEDASLLAGESIIITLGDRSGGSIGWRQQTFQEIPFPVRVCVDPFATGLFHNLPQDIGWNITPGELDHYILCVPSHGRIGERFKIKIKGMDRWGNPLRDMARYEIQLLCNDQDKDLSLKAEGKHNKGIWVYTLNFDSPGIYTFKVCDTKSYSNSIIIREKNQDSTFPAFNWCDLHGQTGETVGAGTVEEYFEFGRHYAFLDGISPQGNDLQLTSESWETIKKATEDAYRPGEYVTFPGYEWSGTTTMGGDYNVIYFEENPPLYRSTGWLAGNPFEEVSPLPNLIAKLKTHKAIAMAHIGGRPASLEHWDPDVTPLVEIHSAWGTFEWVYKKCFEKGYKIGFACNSDDHKTRPGGSYPGAGIFGTLGGLTCILSAEKTREGFWDAIKNRQCYGTTGQRITVEAELNKNMIGQDVMANQGEINLQAVGTAPVMRIDLFRKSQVIKSVYPLAGESKPKVVIRFGGARVYGRARIINWKGRVKVLGNTLRNIDFNGTFNPDHGLICSRKDEAEFICNTSGNSMNMILDFEENLTGEIVFESNVCKCNINLADLTKEPQNFYQAEIDQFLEIFLISDEKSDSTINTKFSLNFDGERETPYFIRVLQLDESKAWTSPWYVTTKNNTK